MPEPTHAQALLILGICLAPAILQALVDRRVHALWLGTAVVAAVATVLLW